MHLINYFIKSNFPLPNDSFFSIMIPRFIYILQLYEIIFIIKTPEFHSLNKYRNMVEKRVYSPDGRDNDNFGNSLDYYENLCVIGAYGMNVNGVISGAALIYRVNNSNWIQEAKLTSEHLRPNDFFGWSVAVYSNIVVVGAYMAQVDSISIGSAYVFFNGGTSWSLQAVLSAHSTDTYELLHLSTPSYDYFGWSVDTFEETIFVGAYGDNIRGAFSGAVYIFNMVSYEASSWSQTTKIFPADGSSFYSFGWCISLFSNYAVIGAYGDTHPSKSYVGSAYIFGSTSEDTLSPKSWTQLAKLVPTDGTFNDFFGWSVAMWDRTVVVGSHWSSLDKQTVGAAYVFVSDTNDIWTCQAKLTASDDQAGNYFGYSVGIYDNIIAVSAFGDQSGYSNDDGVVYVFESVADSNQPADSRWIQTQILIPNNTVIAKDFGSSVVIWDKTVVVGARRADGVVPNTGAVYVFYEGTIDASMLSDYFPVDSQTFVALVAYLPLTFIFVLGGGFIYYSYFSRRRNAKSIMIISPSNVDNKISTVDDSFDTSSSSFTALIAMDSVHG